MRITTLSTLSRNNVTLPTLEHKLLFADSVDRTTTSATVSVPDALGTTNAADFTIVFDFHHLDQRHRAFLGASLVNGMKSSLVRLANRS